MLRCKIHKIIVDEAIGILKKCEKLDDSIEI